MKYRKKPVVIDAILWNATTKAWNEIQEMGCTNIIPGEMGTKSFSIRTLEGTMRADFGDWIIKGINGEFYPCKPDIFEKTYQPESESTSPVEQDAVRFAEWIVLEGWRHTHTNGWYLLDDDEEMKGDKFHTTAELYQLFITDKKE